MPKEKNYADFREETVAGMTYGHLKQFLSEEIPPTWYPGLLAAIVEASIKKDVWEPGGCTRYVQAVESRHA